MSTRMGRGASVAMTGNTRKASSRNLQRNFEPTDRIVALIEEARGEIRRAAAVDDGRAYHVSPLAQRDALRDAVVDHALAIVVERDDRFAVEPPSRRGVRADREAHVPHLAR